MKSVTIVRILSTSIILLVSPVAIAQTIHTYGDTEPAKPAPVVESTAGQVGAGEAARPEGSDDGVMDYYQVSAYNAQSSGKSRSRPNEALLKILSLSPNELYSGVIPGTRDRPEHLERAHVAGMNTSAPNQLTWIGFAPEATRTRVFLQSARKPDYEITRSDDGKTFTVTFANTRLPERNFSRQIDTSFFKRPVQRILAAQQKGGTVQVMIKLDKGQEPTIVRDGAYLFIDFPHTAPAVAASPQP